MTRIISFQTPQDAEVDFPRPDRLLSNHNPRRETREYYQSPDQTLNAGTWTCEVGQWKIHFADHKEEFFCVISGRVRLHSEQGETWEFGPGQAEVIPRGFKGSFEVIEKVTKHYVIYEREP